jgi:TonB-linked SusC/RagA family outer membrane protein
LANYANVKPVNWQDEVFGNTGVATTHNLTAGGGNKKMTYNFAYTYNDDKAVVLNSSYKRHLINVKGDYKITKKIKVGAGLRYTNQNVYGAGVSDNKGSSYNRLRNAVKYRPFLSTGQDIDDQDPLADPNVGNGLNLVNPIMLSNAEYRRKTTDAINFNFSASYTIRKNLVFKSVFGYDDNSFVDRQYSDSVTPYSVIQGSRKPIAGLDTSKRKTLTNTNTLTYSIVNFRNKHDFTFLLGEETYDLKTTNQSTLVGKYPNFTSYTDAFSQTNLGTYVTGYPKLNKTRYTSASFFGRINYSFMSKYLFTMNFRADGASKFAPGKQWGYFPGASVAWKVSDEKFMEKIKGISNLKFRAGFGELGNNRMGDYLYLTSFRNDGTYFYGLNNQAVLAYYSGSLVNENLKWESTVNKNIGMDVSLFNNRIDLSVDLYNNVSKDLLLTVPVAPTFGYTTQLQNIGKTSNKGLEVQLNALVLKKKNNFNWNMSFNISTNKNEIKALGRSQNFFYPAASWGVSGQPTDYIIKIGQAVGSMYGLVTDGFYKVSDFDYNTTTSQYTLKAGLVSDSSIIGAVSPGSIKFKDLNGDGTIDLNNDRKIIGNPTPKFTGGFTNTFTYKQWDLSVFVNFSYGNDIYNANKIEFTNGYTPNANILEIMKDRFRVVKDNGETALWTNSSNKVYGISPAELEKLNVNAKIWSPIKSAGAFYPHSWAIEDGSFIRLNNLTIGYSLPVKTLAKWRMSKLRFYLTGNNLAIITNYTGYDPEVSVKGSPLTPGLDYSAYPKSRSFIFGVNVSF